MGQRRKDWFKPQHQGKSPLTCLAPVGENPNVQLVTHDSASRPGSECQGRQHPDETWACAVLYAVLTRMGYCVWLVRTRNERQLADLGRAARQPGSNIFLLDVGGGYCAPNVLDHKHGSDPNLQHRHRRGSGAPLATFGLTWQIWGRRLVDQVAERVREQYHLPVPDDVCQRVWQIIDSALVEEVDYHDLYGPGTSSAKVEPGWAAALRNTVADSLQVSNQVGNTLAALLAGNRAWSQQENRRFVETVQHTVALLEMAIESRLVAEWKASLYSLVKDGRTGETILMVHVPLDVWKDTALGVLRLAYASSARLVVVNQQAGIWRVMCRDEQERLPIAWRGQRGVALVDETGIQNALECARDGTWVTARNKHAALALATKALKEGWAKKSPDTEAAAWLKAGD